METKICIKCGVEKELNLFRRQKAYKDGYENTCKECLYGHKPLKRYTVGEVTEKECKHCKQILPIESFNCATIKKGKIYYSSSCRKCRYEYIEKPGRAKSRFYRKRNLKLSYGITLDVYDQMESLQNKKCRICGYEINDGEVLCVDHNHATGKIRGLLCNNCNTGLGMFKDNPDVLLSAINYLKEFTS